jgi:hypothetical protein
MGNNFVRGRNKPVHRFEVTGEGQKEGNNNYAMVVSDQGTSSVAGAPAIPQIGVVLSQPAMSQGTAVDLVYVAKSSIMEQKGKKEKCFRCNLPVDHVGNECSAVLCIFCDSALHKDADCHLL